MLKNLKNIGKLVVVGGSASGAAAAARARRLDEDCHIVVLTIFQGEEIENRDKLLVTPIPLLEGGYNFDLRAETEVVKIDPSTKTILARGIDGEEYEESYDKLMLAMGSDPFIPPIDGLENCGMSDMDQIYQKAATSNSCVIVGGGFIGLELAEQLKKRGLEVDVVELLPHLIPPLDSEIAVLVHTELEKHNIGIHLNTQVTSLEIDDENENELTVHLTPGDSLSTDFVVLSTGVRPRSDLAKNAGLSLSNSAILVNEHMQTSSPDIYAAGDLVLSPDRVMGGGGHIYVPLANAANIQGRVAANHMFGGEPDTYGGTTGCGIFQAFDITVCMIGQTEERLLGGGGQLLEKVCEKGESEGESTTYGKAYCMLHHRPGYMPLDVEYESAITTKTLFGASDGVILGFQAVGPKGVDSLGQAMSVALHRGDSVYDLESVEGPYCPYFSGARSGVNMIGMVGAGVLRGTHLATYMEEVLSDSTEEPEIEYLIDVRPKEKFEKGNIPHTNVVNVPLPVLRDRIDKLVENKNARIVCSCGIGKQAYWASRMLQGKGYTNVTFLPGSWALYSRHYKK